MKIKADIFKILKIILSDKCTFVPSMIQIAIFASGSGTNAENIISYFQNNSLARVSLVVTNNPKAGVIERAQRLNIPVVVFTKKELSDPTLLLHTLSEKNIGFIVLAGFLLLVPERLVTAFENKIINIHPALLPDFGGKGFYGQLVHQKVIDLKCLMSGITIHHVNNEFDKGSIIFQAACHVDKNESVESLAEKIHQLEQKYFPVVIEKTISQLSRL